MQTVLRTTSRVLSGHRLEIFAPELPEGAMVETVVFLPNGETAQKIAESPSSPNALMNFLHRLPAGPRAYSTWDEYEPALGDEKSTWDR